MSSGDGESGSKCQTELTATVEGLTTDVLAEGKAATVQAVTTVDVAESKASKVQELTAADVAESNAAKVQALTTADVAESKADAPTADTEHEPSQPDAADVSADQQLIAPGKDVIIIGTQMSGSLGVVADFSEEKQRWRVTFASGMTKNFKAENLQIVKAKKQKRRRVVSEIRQETPKVPIAAAGPQRSRTADLTDQSVSQIMERLGAAPSTALPHRSSVAAPAADVQPQEETPAKEFAAHEEIAVSQLEPEIQVNLAGFFFSGKAELRAHIKAIQGRCEDTEDGKVVSAEDMFLLYHLVMQHSTLAEKLQIASGSAVQGFRYGTDPRFPKNQCFSVLFADGSSEPVSLTKCVNEVLLLGNGQRKRGADAPGPASKRSRVAVEEPPLEITERSRAETGLVLIRDEASAARTWEYKLMDERRRSFAAYLPCPFPSTELERCFKKAHAGTDWRQPEDPRSGEPIPRKTAWMVRAGCACTYRYGGIDVAPQEYSPWLLEIMQMYMPLCGLADREAWPDSCNLNLYEDGDMSVGWHADNENLFQGRTDDIRIISVSLGQTRTFELRTQDIVEDGARAKCTMRLSNGDLCTMEGLAQKYYHHRVPKEAASEGPRINFTWRWIKQHRPGCPMQHVKKKKRLSV